jgi:hypothetical protein
LIIGRETEKLPFNIAGMRAIDYPSLPLKEEWSKGGDRVEDARDRLRTAIIVSLRPGLPDRPAHTLVPGLNVSRPSKPLNYRFGIECRLDDFIRRNLSGDPKASPAARRSGLSKRCKKRRRRSELA